jgi:pimeloyl-ACP methyl ester carboxylesterase
VNGARLHYEEAGAGTTVVLIHGGLVSSAMWAPVLPHLGDGLHVITPDSRGHGRSTNPSGELSYAQIADDLAALIEALGLVRPVVRSRLGAQLCSPPSSATSRHARCERPPATRPSREMWRRRRR